ncbi:hypothetical protein LINPERPRIM_LOCUS7244 [Linum perenne]
MIVWEYLKPG